MPRPRTRTDDEILDAAARVVGRDGPARLTLAGVGAECGLSAAALIRRFGSKHALLLALSRRSIHGVATTFARARAGHPGDDRAAAIAALLDLAGPVEDPRAFANHLAFLHLDLVDPELHALAKRHADAVRAELAALLGDRDLARALHTTYNGSLIGWAIDAEGSLPDRLRADLAALLNAKRAAR